MKATVVVVQLVERSLPASENRGSNPMPKFTCTFNCIEKPKENKDEEAGNGPILKTKKVYLDAYSYKVRQVIFKYFFAIANMILSRIANNRDRALTVCCLLGKNSLECFVNVARNKQYLNGPTFPNHNRRVQLITTDRRKFW